MLIWLPFVLVIIWSIRIMIVARGHYSVGHLLMLKLDTTRIWPRPSKFITTHYGQCILPDYYFAKSNIISQSESSTNLIASLIGISVTIRYVPFIPLVGVIPFRHPVVFLVTKLMQCQSYIFFSPFMLRNSYVMNELCVLRRAA